jgi:hypothetical protein
MKEFIKKNLSTFIISIALLLILLFSLAIYFVKNNSKSYVFIFPSADNESYIVERRNLSKDSVQGEINYFIDELLLGSGVERTKLIFSLGTKVNSCFLRDDILYLDISEDLLNIDESSYPIENGINLLKENILKNFSNINKVELFIGKRFVASLEK